MSDNEIIEAVARLFIDNGGDSDGFWYLSNNISGKIDEMKETL